MHTGKEQNNWGEEGGERRKKKITERNKERKKAKRKTGTENEEKDKTKTKRHTVNIKDRMNEITEKKRT